MGNNYSITLQDSNKQKCGKCGRFAMYKGEFTHKRHGRFKLWECGNCNLKAQVKVN